MSKNSERPKDSIDPKTFSQMVKSDEELKTIDLDTVAKDYGISKRSLLRYVESGKLRAIRFGRKSVVTIAELKRFLSGTDSTS